MGLHYFDADWEAYCRGVDDGSIVFDVDTMDRPYYRHLVPCAVCGKPDALTDEHYGPIEVPDPPDYPGDMLPSERKDER